MPSKYRKSTKPRTSPTGKKSPPTGIDADLNLATLLPLFSDENKAREFLEQRRWPNGPVCPHCECTECYTLTAKPGSKSPVRPGVHKCKACRKQFTVRIGTIYEESKIPLSKWLMAIHLMTSSKKGVSSHQIARELGVTQKTAWFLCHRIRESMKMDVPAGALAGTIEADECYIGGKPRPKFGEPGAAARGRGTKKAPVLALVQRNGAAVCKPLPVVNGKELRKELALVAREAILMTDENSSYNQPGKAFAAHHTVNHSAGEYARDVNGFNATTNTVESFFALLKARALRHFPLYEQAPLGPLLRRIRVPLDIPQSHRRRADGSGHEGRGREAAEVRIADQA